MTCKEHTQRTRCTGKKELLNRPNRRVLSKHPLNKLRADATINCIDIVTERPLNSPICNSPRRLYNSFDRLNVCSRTYEIQSLISSITFSLPVCALRRNTRGRLAFVRFGSLIIYFRTQIAPTAARMRPPVLLRALFPVLGARNTTERGLKYRAVTSLQLIARIALRLAGAGSYTYRNTASLKSSSRIIIRARDVLPVD